MNKASKTILTAIMGKLADQVFDMATQYSDQVIKSYSRGNILNGLKLNRIEVKLESN